MRTKLSLLLFLFVNFYMLAQDRIGIAFIPITYDEESVSNSDARMIHESVINSFVKTKRFAVVDREKLQALEDEKKLQRTESFIDSKQTIQDGVSRGASYLIATNILSLRHSEVKRGWESMLQVQVKVLDVSTGEIIATENITSEYIEPSKMIMDAREKFASKKEIKAMEEKTKKMQEIKMHKEDAFSVALERLDENMKSFSNVNFPITLDILSWDTKNRNLFMIAAGSGIGLSQGQLLDVVHTTEATIGDRTITRNQKIAVACIIKVEDANFSEALIISTEKAYKKVRESNGAIKILTK